MTKKVFIKTFGCQMNEYDSDKMADVLGAAEGYEPTQDVELRRRGEPTQATPVVPPITPEPTPSGAVPEDWWQPEPQAAPPAAGQVLHPLDPIGDDVDETAAGEREITEVRS